MKEQMQLCHPDIIKLLEGSYDGEDLLKKIKNSKSELEQIRIKFNIEYGELMRSKLIAKSYNEHSLDFYQEEEFKFKKLEKILNEAEEKINENY
nr:MAG TPA: hypothetical protein [Caudoviricetes sp.]